MGPLETGLAGGLAVAAVVGLGGMAVARPEMYRAIFLYVAAGIFVVSLLGFAWAYGFEQAAFASAMAVTDGKLAMLHPAVSTSETLLFMAGGLTVLLILFGLSSVALSSRPRPRRRTDRDT